MRKVFTVCAAVAVVVCVAVLLFMRKEQQEYKTLYRDEIMSAAEEFSVPAEIIFAVVRCESSFDPNAVSPAGAKGLMQLMPATFDEVAWRLKEDPAPELISDPAFSIRYGTYYISYLIRYFGNEDTAVAAYNAGMGKVRSWLADSRYSDDGVTLKHIPYKETSDYVKKVLKARAKYHEILEGDKK